jgi:hypothetical protein
MSSLGDRLDAIELHVRVPGTEIEAHLRRRDEITISFGPDRYAWLGERDLEHYLASLARLLYTAWSRAYRAALSDAFLAAMGPEDQRDRDFLAARSELHERGVSNDGRITITAVDMRDITVRITDGTLRVRTEQEFVAGTREAVAALIKDHMSKVHELKMKYFT